MKTVMAQCNKWADDEDNYIERKLERVENDQDVRNLVFNRLQMNADVSDMELQREVIEVYGDRYPDMALNDWRHIIEDYTPMIREANQRKAKEIVLNLQKAASPENE